VIAGIPRSSKQRRFQPDGITVETYKHRERSTWRWRFITDLGEKDSGMVGTARPSSALDVTGDSERADMGLRLIQACGCRVCLTRPRPADPLFRPRGPGPQT